MEHTALDLQSFQQEYECTFVDSAESYIPLDLIYNNTPGLRPGDRNTELEDGQGEKDDGLEVRVFKTADELILWYEPEKHGHLLYLGYDVARTRDAAVIFIIGLLPNGQKKSVAQIEMFGQTFEYQRDQIRKIMNRLPIVRGCIDKTGQGEDTTETLQGEYTSTRLEGIDFNLRSKEELAIGVREGLEKKEFLLQNDDRFRRQVHSIKRIPSSGGACRYDSERDDLGHADSFWAWALANHAIPGGSAVKGFYQQHREKRAAKNEVVSPEQKKGKSLHRVLREWGNGLLRKAA
jgi:phage FluMu gp28-like protein